MTEKEQVNQVSWNLSQSLINEISMLLYEANQGYLKGLIFKAFFYLKAIRLRIIQDIKLNELQKLKEIEQRIFKIKAMEKKSLQEKRELTAYYYEQYNDLIMIYLKKYGYSIPEKEDKTILSA